MQFDLSFAENVIRSEAQAIENMVPKVVNESFAKAAEMMLECQGSVILTGIGKAGIIGRKISATLASTGTPSHFTSSRGDSWRPRETSQRGYRFSIELRR
jgi:arabinose-5-phosphate isomerase